MSRIISRYTSSRGNKLIFSTGYLHKGDVKHVVVTDTSCALERCYYIGNISRKLNHEESPIEVTSIEQVIKAWTNEEVHF